ncbi:MAG TPA: HAMP domain-containing sensor histidine kinase [Chitinophagales bacterium]|nr:HAMP domain-containing sensor histidine kinase [Chitinophagales bacterium]
MLRKLFAPSPFTIFYVVFAYILAFALWWAYLLYEKNETAYHEKVELNSIEYKRDNPHGDYTTTDSYLQIHIKYERQKLMIVGEGSVFIVLLLLGLMMVRRVFVREMELAAQQRNFLLSITHELKSPVSTVKLSLQTMLKRKLEAEQANKLVNNSLVDMDRLESLIDNILFAARIERDEPGFANDEINISEIVSQSTERAGQNKKGITVNAEVMPDVFLHADAIGFTSVVNNLLENAIKYSGTGKSVSVKLKQEGPLVTMLVADEGIGIAQKERSRIFEKFYRVGSEDTRNTKGTGLGLYIVKRFVEIYRGHISVEDNQPKGTVFRVSFPVAG